MHTCRDLYIYTDQWIVILPGHSTLAQLAYSVGVSPSQSYLGSSMLSGFQALHVHRKNIPTPLIITGSGIDQ